MIEEARLARRFATECRLARKLVHKEWEEHARSGQRLLVDAMNRDMQLRHVFDDRSPFPSLGCVQHATAQSLMVAQHADIEALRRVVDKLGQAVVQLQECVDEMRKISRQMQDCGGLPCVNGMAFQHLIDATCPIVEQYTKELAFKRSVVEDVGQCDDAQALYALTACWISAPYLSEEEVALWQEAVRVASETGEGQL